MTPRLSIVVCTFNRASILDRCLQSLHVQVIDSSAFEVLVVDNGSTDDTRQRVARFIENDPRYRYIHEPRQGLSFARNRGAGEATAPYLTYVDDDAMAPPHFVRGLLDIIEHQHPDIVGGPILPYFTSPKPRWFRDQYEIRQYAETSGFSTTCGVSGSNFTIRRELVSQLGGFNVNLGMKGTQAGYGEERALLLAYRGHVPVSQQRIYYALECEILHWVPPHKLRLAYMMRRHFEGGMMHVKIEGRAVTREETTREFTRAPLAILRYLSRQYRQGGLRRFDYVDTLLTACFHAGIFTAILRRLPSRVSTQLRG